MWVFNSFSNDTSEQMYDSTWEDEQDSTESPEPNVWGRNIYAAKDMQSYRRFYRTTKSKKGTNDDLDNDDEDDDKDMPNVRFYRNEIKFYPDGVLIEDFHKHWSDNYNQLEYVHSYIQWLFPIQEKGMNYASQELSLKEIKLFRRDLELKKRFLQSYKIMLKFYGIELVSEETGEVKRAGNWEERFKNLNRNTHNNLRITRILKSLGLLGFRRYQKPLVHFFLEETLKNGTLSQVKQSALDYFMFAVLNRKERKDLIRSAFFMFDSKDNFVWCPMRINKKFLKEKEASHGSDAARVSSDSSSQRDQMNSRVQNQEEIKTAADEDTNNHSFSSKSRNDENMSGERQDPEALPVPAAGNVKSSDTSERIEAPSRVDPEHAGHVDSEHKAAIQKDEGKAGNQVIPNSAQKAKEKADEGGDEDADSTKETNNLIGAKNFDNSAASNESTNENLTQTSNHSSTSENGANETPPVGANSGSGQQDLKNQEDESEQGDKAEFKSQHTDGDSTEKSGGETPKDTTVTGTETNREAKSTRYNAETPADKNKNSLHPKEASRPSRSSEQTSEQNSVSFKKIETSGSDRNLQDEHQDGNQGDGIGALGNLDQRSEQQKQGRETVNELKPTTEAKGQRIEKKGDPAHEANKDNTVDRLIDGGAGNVPSLNNERLDPADIRNRDCTQSEQSGAALRSDVNTAQEFPKRETYTAESSNVKYGKDEMTDIGCVRDIGTGKEENI